MPRESSERPQNYASPAIIARRKRILDETRKAIAEQGIAALSMHEIGKRAGVAKRTLYNAFQTRDRMIAAAIQEYFEEFVALIPYEHPAGTMLHNLEQLIALVQRNQKIRNYSRAVMALYYSAELDQDIFAAMHAMAARANQQWLQALHDKKQLQPWVDVDQLGDELVCIEYAIINDWSLGRIADDRIVVQLVTVSLTYVLGATRGEAHKEIEDLLLRIAQEGEKALPIPKPIRADKAA